MSAIINGKRYDVRTAKFVDKAATWPHESRYKFIRLYVKRTGEFFFFYSDHEMPKFRTTNAGALVAIDCKYKPCTLKDAADHIVTRYGLDRWLKILERLTAK